ncbi:MAG: Ig-like domain-containing protein [Euryarchaeota archaeon]|nr:Ig-like domain-containing protein [Euryarchaeota archaeon]
MAADDTTPPTVSSIDPVDAAMGVSLNKPIIATFSEAMDAATITNSTFNLTQGLTKVPGSVTTVNSTATFTPTNYLLAGTIYTVTITTGVMDLAGNPLASDYTWNFTTSTSSASAVVLGTAGDFVILAKTGISTTGTTGIVGDIGISPASFTYITGFGLIMDSSNEFSTSSIIDGKVYASDYAPPTPTKMTTTISDMETAYNVAAGAAPGYTELGAGTLSGLTLTAGVYKWSSGVTITTSITLTGSADDVWIFIIAGNLEVSSSVQIILAGAALPSNIFWIVAGQTTIGTTAVVQGTILDQTGIVIETGATVIGRALAQTAVTLDASSVLMPTDIVAPTVISTIPANSDTDVAVNSAVSATFNEPMAPTNITTTTFTLKHGSTSVAGTVTYSGVTAVFTPDADLIASTVYTATITTGAKDLAGNELASNYTWSFTTGVALDATPPTVSSVYPTNAATNVDLNIALSATFNEPMDPVSISITTFTLKHGSTAVSGIVTYSGVTTVFTPIGNLAASTVYIATITTGAKDLAGNALASNYTWSFTTGAAPDTTAPTVISTVPAISETGVILNSAISATFSEAMNPLKITTTTFTLKQGAMAVAGTVTYSGITAVFTPTNDLSGSSVYTATITIGAEDLAGNALASNYTWSFTTGVTPDTIAPTVISVDPTNGATSIALNSAISATFSEAMNPLKITTTTFTLKQGAMAVAGTVTYSGVIAVFTPTSALSASTVYTATITTGAKDLAGNAFASNYTCIFTTGVTPDTIAPTVISVDPTNGATSIALNKAISATFSEAMYPLSITTVSFTLKQGATAVAGTVTYSGVTAVFTPTSALSASTLYTATITTVAKDLAGNALASNYTWSFTTGAAEDEISPTVISTVPVSSATGIALNSAVSVTFSEAMNPLTITTVSFTLKHGATAVAGTVTYSGVTAVFTPTSALSASTVYTVTITTGIKDLAGNVLASSYVWTFTTGAAVDAVAPTVISTLPSSSGTDVSGNSSVSATFSEAMNPLTITAATFSLMQGTTVIAGTVTYSGVTAVFTPTVDLEEGTTYTATITIEVKDLAGNAMASEYTWTFTTTDGQDDSSSSGFPLWAIIVIIVAAVGAALFVIYSLVVKKPQKK